MIKIETLKDYLHEKRNMEFLDIVNKIYNLTDFISGDYPDYRDWFFMKQLYDVDTDERNILFVRSPDNKKDIIAIAFLKKTVDEKKICTLYVVDRYRRMGIGTLLLEESMKWLGTTRPLITFSNKKVGMFSSIIKKYNWELVEVSDNFYSNGSCECCYNDKNYKNVVVTSKKRSYCKK